MKRSPTLAEKLNARFVPDNDIVDATRLIAGTHSMARFDSQQEFAKYLSEGSLLNVSVIGSKALSVPCGEYMVWMTDAGHTVLFPTGKAPSREVFEHNREHYEVQTRDLMANWNKLERVLAEDVPLGPTQQQQNLEQNEENLEEPEGEPGDPNQGQSGEFRSTIDASTVDRTPIMRAMQDRGYTVTSLADEVGVDPPAISRILRTPKDVQGDPGGRNPSMGLASQICNVLRIDPTAAFPDIFNANKYDARQTPGNAGSGDQGHHGKGMAPGIRESLNESIEILEATENYEVLCEAVQESQMPFEIFWKNVFWPSVRRIRKGTGLVEFVDTMRGLHEEVLTEWGLSSLLGGGRSKAQPAQTAQPAQPTPTAKPKPRPTKDAVAAYQQQGFDNFVGQANRVQGAADKMTSTIMPPIQQAFQSAMEQLKNELQQAQLDIKRADPKIAPHAWEVINRFYKTVMKAGQSYSPAWKAAAPGTKPGYDAEYQKARGEFERLQGQTQAPQAKPQVASGMGNEDPLAT